MAAKHRLIAVPTGYNIYRVSDDVVAMHKAEFMSFPPAVVLETLVMQGMAKVAARIRPYDIEYEEGEEPTEGLYEQGDDEEVEEAAPPDNPAPPEGLWYTSDDEDDKGE